VRTGIAFVSEIRLSWCTRSRAGGDFVDSIPGEPKHRHRN